MSRYRRTTLASAVEVSGVGLFTATPSTVRLSPLQRDTIDAICKDNASRVLAHTGFRFIFRRTDVPASLWCLAGPGAISTGPIHPAFATMPPRCTCLDVSQTGFEVFETGAGSAAQTTATVGTVEHVLGALVGMGITDALIDVDGPEVPIMDGSALAFAQLIDQAGTTPIDGEVVPMLVRAPIVIERAGTRIEVHPSEFAAFTYALDYGDSSPITPGVCSWMFDEAGSMGGGDAVVATGRDGFFSLVAPARTFSLKSEVDHMRAKGLFSHLDTTDMLVIDQSGPIATGYRHPQECALHKLLDLIGDLSLAGAPIAGHVVGARTGHAANHAMAREIGLE